MARKIVKWNWINHDGTKYYDLGVNEDGSLHNPNGYPDDLVRAAVRGAEERLHTRRSAAAQKAAETRRERQEACVYEVARKYISGQWQLKMGGYNLIERRHRCFICHKKLTDDDSIARGIGSDCWQGVLDVIKVIQEKRQ